MVEISSSGSGGGLGWATAPGYPIPRPRDPLAATRDPALRAARNYPTSRS